MDHYLNPRYMSQIFDCYDQNRFRDLAIFPVHNADDANKEIATDKTGMYQDHRYTGMSGGPLQDGSTVSQYEDHNQRTTQNELQNNEKAFFDQSQGTSVSPFKIVNTEMNVSPSSSRQPVSQNFYGKPSRKRSKASKTPSGYKTSDIKRRLSLDMPEMPSGETNANRRYSFDSLPFSATRGKEWSIATHGPKSSELQKMYPNIVSANESPISEGNFSNTFKLQNKEVSTSIPLFKNQGQPINGAQSKEIPTVSHVELSSHRHQHYEASLAALRSNTKSQAVSQYEKKKEQVVDKNLEQQDVYSFLSDQWLLEYSQLGAAYYPQEKEDKVEEWLDWSTAEGTKLAYEKYVEHKLIPSWEEFIANYSVPKIKIPRHKGTREKVTENARNNAESVNPDESVVHSGEVEKCVNPDESVVHSGEVEKCVNPDESVVHSGEVEKCAPDLTSVGSETISSSIENKDTSSPLDTAEQASSNDDDAFRSQMFEGPKGRQILIIKKQKSPLTGENDNLTEGEITLKEELPDCQEYNDFEFDMFPQSPVLLLDDSQLDNELPPAIDESAAPSQNNSLSENEITPVSEAGTPESSDHESLRNDSKLCRDNIETTSQNSSIDHETSKNCILTESCKNSTLEEGSSKMRVSCDRSALLENEVTGKEIPVVQGDCDDLIERMMSSICCNINNEEEVKRVNKTIGSVNRNLELSVKELLSLLGNDNEDNTNGKCRKQNCENQQGLEAANINSPKITDPIVPETDHETDPEKNTRVQVNKMLPLKKRFFEETPTEIIPDVKKVHLEEGTKKKKRTSSEAKISKKKKVVPDKSERKHKKRRSCQRSPVKKPTFRPRVLEALESEFYFYSTLAYAKSKD